MVKRIRFCGGVAVGYRNVFRLKRPGDIRSISWPQLEGRQVIGTYRGRSAVALACRLLGIGPNDEVLAPAYNCGTEVDALLDGGASVLGYRITPQGEVDIADMELRLSKRTRAVYIIHYFGWEQPMRKLRSWCDEHGLYLIEDCALALFSGGSNGEIGQLSDAAIFSLPKTLGVSCGGILSLLPSRAVEIPRLAQPASFSVLKQFEHSGRVMTFACLDYLGLYGILLKISRRLRRKRLRTDVAEGSPPMPKSYYFNHETDADRGLPHWTQAMASSFDPRQVVTQRRQNYLRLANGLEENPGVKLLFAELPLGVCPLSMPIIVSNRDACVNLLQGRGIAALPWWSGFHQGAIDWPQFPEACWLKQNVLTLPIHQGLNAEHVDYIVKVTNQVIKTVKIGK